MGKLFLFAILKEIFEHSLRAVKELLCDGVVLGILIAHRFDSVLRKFKHSCPGKSHQNRRMGGDYELGILLYKAVHLHHQGHQLHG